MSTDLINYYNIILGMVKVVKYVLIYNHMNIIKCINSKTIVNCFSDVVSV